MKENIQKYYSETLETNEDLKTSACCSAEAMPAYIKKLLKNIHDDVLDKFYGCGSPIPHCLEGKTVLDLGCGSGRDSYLLSQLVGKTGSVVGIDMTDNQLSIANKYVEYHMDKFGYQSQNIKFCKGFIEDLSMIEDNSFDLVISNCVINLSTDKEKVFSEIFRVLKSGGELYFSDIFADRRIPASLQKDSILAGECLSGALYIEDFRRMLHRTGFHDYRALSDSIVTLEDDEVKTKIGMVNFHSITVRTFKCEFEDICENYGHVAYYKGTIPETPHSFILDDHHEFKTGFPVSVCGNTSKMLSETRYKEHFRVDGNFSTHLGAFDCKEGGSKTSSIACCY